MANKKVKETRYYRLLLYSGCLSGTDWITLGIYLLHLTMVEDRFMNGICVAIIGFHSAAVSITITGLQDTILTKKAPRKPSKIQGPMTIINSLVS
jgi:hypothetical protein